MAFTGVVCYLWGPSISSGTPGIAGAFVINAKLKESKLHAYKHYIVTKHY